MRDRKRKNLNIPNLELHTSAEMLAAIQMGLIVVLIELRLWRNRPTHPALPLMVSISGDVNGNLQSSRQHSKTGNVVLMLVSDHDGRQL